MAKRKNKRSSVKAQNNIFLGVFWLLLLLFFNIVAACKLGMVGEQLNHSLSWFLGWLYSAFIFAYTFYFAYKTFVVKPLNSFLTITVFLLMLSVICVSTIFSISRNNFDSTNILNLFLKSNPSFFTINDSVEIYANYGFLPSLIIQYGSKLFDPVGLLILLIVYIIAATAILVFLSPKNKKKKTVQKPQPKVTNNSSVKKKNLFIDIPQEPSKVKAVITDLLFESEEESQKRINNKKIKKEIKKNNAKKKTAIIDVDTTSNKKTNDVKSEISNVNKPVHKSNLKYKLPPISTLNEYKVTNEDELNFKSANDKAFDLLKILSTFDINCSLVDTHIGPSVTEFEIRPDSDVKVNRINNLSDNIKMELAAKEIRIEAPIPGRNTVGIEIPNKKRVTVGMQEIIKKIPVDKKYSPLLFTLGKNLMGESIFGELNKMPHMLIAGSTGSGKSVCINSIICSLLLRTKPDEVKMILIDPKKVEFTPYHDIPHLLMPVITDTSEAIFALKRVCVMMDDRFSLFSQTGVRNITDYNILVDENNSNPENVKMDRMPFIVVIIDELADLMIMGKKEVEPSIQRITQLARACGIHLIVATQRPSTDVITGVIKSNIPSRIAFAVSSSIDSRTILDRVGAEKLLGNGDMLYYPMGSNNLLRVQGVFVSDKEIKAITTACKSQGVIPQYDDAYFEFKNGVSSGSMSNNNGRVGDKDSLYDEVKQYIIQQQKASTSLVQRRFSVGVNRAGRIIDMLEEEGIIGPANSSKPREVFVKG